MTTFKEIELMVKSLNLNADLFEKSMFRARFRTLKKVSSFIAKEAANDLKIAQKLIRQRIYLSPRRSRLTIHTFAIPLSIMPFYATKKGIKLRGGSRIYPHSFEGKSSIGKLKVKIYKRLSSSRLPVKMEALEIKKDVEHVLDRLSESWIKEIFLRELLHEVKFRGGVFRKNV